jgi:hypothetical protein
MRTGAHPMSLRWPVKAKIQKVGVTSVTGTFVVSIQNNAAYDEVIPDFATLKKNLNLAFTGTFNCVNDPLASSKTTVHPDYKTVAHVSHPGLDGIADTVPANDDRPHNPFGTDRGCGGEEPDKTLGGYVLTDVIVK